MPSAKMLESSATDSNQPLNIAKGSRHSVETIIITTILLSPFAFFSENSLCTMSPHIEKNSFIILIILCLKAMNTASRVPRCSTAEKNSAPSPLFPVKC